ncbi:MAG: hypothetical protein ACXWCG_10775 [Flavitalea sp.]
MKIFEKEHEPFKTNGKTTHFTPEKPIPAMLAKKVVRTRIKENEGKNALKQLVNLKK